MGKEIIEGIGSDYASRENRPKPQTYEAYESSYHIAENGSRTATTAPVVKKGNAGEGNQDENQEDRAKEERERVASEASIKEAANRVSIRILTRLSARSRRKSHSTCSRRCGRWPESSSTRSDKGVSVCQ